MQSVRFEIPPCPPELVERLRRELGVSDALGQVLVRRALGDPDVARRFLAATDEHPPQAFAGIADAVAMILEHARGGSRITVHGDYDVDGICSTAILVRTLRELGADVDSFIPDRAEGYGLSQATVERLAARGTRLLITADCAITAVEEIEAARELGMAVVVTDHHTPRADGRLPDAPIVHPAVCGYPFDGLCATAVAYKLAQALLGASGGDERRLSRDLDLVALATVADVVPLLDENRTLLRRGLRALAGTAKPGLRALMAVAGVDPSRIGEREIGFALAPRLNAAGRLYRADAGLELLLTEDPARAAQIARELDSANAERRQIERRIRFEAEAQMAELGERDAYVLAAEGWHPGVIGIVASRMVENSGRPVVMVALDGEQGRGSGRSIEGFDLLGGLRACEEHLLRYGGHRAAAGVELERGRLEDFAAALAEHATGALGPEQPATVERVDAVLDGTVLGLELAEELQSLAPFGRENQPVCLMLAEARLSDPRPMGEGRHLRFTVDSAGIKARGVSFGQGSRLPVPEGETVRATFALEVNEWNGIVEPRLRLRHAEPPTTLESAPADTEAAPMRILASAPVDSPPVAAQPEELVLF
ncbi:MAG TPA: single-stranded-DNA-specific exonuclease RecJ [Solirubrobacteraceae bacterium]|nr:single-stranded-DNA-specific exonuclease RecJ [Solirubrobacteraceae bacterium]